MQSEQGFRKGRREMGLERRKIERER